MSSNEGSSYRISISIKFGLSFLSRTCCWGIVFAGMQKTYNTQRMVSFRISHQLRLKKSIRGFAQYTGAPAFLDAKVTVSVIGSPLSLQVRIASYLSIHPSPSFQAAPAAWPLVVFPTALTVRGICSRPIRSGGITSTACAAPVMFFLNTSQFYFQDNWKPQPCSLELHSFHRLLFLP